MPSTLLQNDLKQEISLDAEVVKPLKNGNSSNILVVDDDRTVRMALVDAFTRENYEVEEASNGMQALNICKRHMPDLSFDGCRDAGDDGFDACQMIRELPHGSDIPVLMITGLEDEAVHLSRPFPRAPQTISPSRLISR